MVVEMMIKEAMGEGAIYIVEETMLDAQHFELSHGTLVGLRKVEDVVYPANRISRVLIPNIWVAQKTWILLKVLCESMRRLIELLEQNYEMRLHIPIKWR